MFDKNLHTLYRKILPLGLRTKINKIFPLGYRMSIQNFFTLGKSKLPESRHEYKSTWNYLSKTAQQATSYVSGEKEENELRATAEQIRQVLDGSVGVKPNDVILEIGCGIGRVGLALAPVCKQWIGCDVSSNMLQYARQRLESYSNVELIEVSGFDLHQVPDESIDLVYCTVVFMHLDEWDRYNYILEAYRVLRPGGRIFVDNFNLRSNEGWEVFETARRNFPRYRPPHISKASTPQEIEVYLERARFQQIRIQEQGMWVYGWGIKSV